MVIKEHWIWRSFVMSQGWVKLIKSTLLIETVIIKNPHIHQNKRRKCQKVKDVENLILSKEQLLLFVKKGKDLKGYKMVHVV